MFSKPNWRDDLVHVGGRTVNRDKTAIAESFCVNIR